MRKHVKDISLEEIPAYQAAVDFGIYEFGAPKKDGEVGVYQIREDEFTESPKKNLV